MTQNKAIVTIIASVACLLALDSCRKAETQQQRDKDEEHGLVVAQELSNSRVQDIEEDATGQLWIATFRGLNRYDGHEYHQYFCTEDSLGLPDNNVQGLLCDRRATATRVSC